jgi:IS30 family transposase
MMPGPKYTAEQKQHFFDLIDKGGTVRAAALAAGIHPDAAYTWLRNAGLTMRRRTPRVYSDAERAEFLRLLAELNNVRAAAAALGFPAVTCYPWAHQAGVYTSRARQVSPRKQEFLRLRQQGLTRADAARAVGADKRSVADWDKGITIIHRGRVYPDGRTVLYPAGPGSAVVTSARTVGVLGGQVDLSRVEAVIHPRYLSLLERERLRDLRREGLSIRAIGREMGRQPSTISRELSRNTFSTKGYLPHAAHRASVARRQRAREPKVLAHQPLGQYVQTWLSKKWSPQQISHRLRKDFPDCPQMRACTETIYQAIYVHARGRLQRDLQPRLRGGRSRRKPHRAPDTRRPRFVDVMTPITDRPADVNSRATAGHWEGDLIIGATGKSAIATLVERSSRFVVLGHLGAERDADTVRDSLINVVRGLPAQLRLSLTWDQGAEMAEHLAFSAATNMPVYFCDPGSPWQRGSNENTNGLLRQYFPKGSDLRLHDTAALQAVADELNGRPRKVLDWDTPAERLDALLLQH